MPQLTPSQRLALKNDITITRASTTFEGETLLTWWNRGADGVLARFYNQTASPTVLLWRPRVATQLLLDATLASEYISGNSPGDTSRRGWFDRFTASPFIDTTNAQVYTNMVAAAGAASSTLAAWTIIARKNASYFEALFLTGSHNGASITAHFEAVATGDDIAQARTV